MNHTTTTDKYILKMGDVIYLLKDEDVVGKEVIEKVRDTVCRAGMYRLKTTGIGRVAIPYGHDTYGVKFLRNSPELETRYKEYQEKLDLLDRLRNGLDIKLPVGTLRQMADCLIG
jgi:hypothetical protein